MTIKVIVIITHNLGKATRDGLYPGTCNFIQVVMGYQQYSSCVTLKVITFYCHKLERAGSLVAALTVSNLARVSVRGTGLLQGK